MKLHHFAKTLVGAVTAPNGQPISTDKALVGYYVSIQPAPGNSNPVYVGGLNGSGNQTVTSTDYGIYIPAPSGSVPPAPLPIDPWRQGLQVTLNQVWVAGTANEVIQVTYWA